MKKLKIYLVSTTKNVGYDEYDSVVVCETSAQKAKAYCSKYGFTLRAINCTLIGIANKKMKAGEVLASFNAG